jgi:signal transduction histidine kinase
LPAQVGDALFQTAQSGQPAQHREITLAQSGRVLSVSTSRFAGRDDTGAFTAGVIEDITELKQEHAHARQLEQQEFILQLASRLSHELKNSLVSINTFAQLLPQQYERKEFRDEFFKIVAHEVTRVDLLVENLTFFAHPLILRYEEVDLTQLLQTTLSRLVEECKRQHGSAVVTTTTGQPTITSVTGKPIVLNARFSHTAKKIACDPKRLSLAIHNMMYNAIQSMPDGGRLSLVTDDAKPNGHAEPRVEISVLDTGEGIALENLKLIFEPFFTTRNVGVGLGLTIAQKIVQKHGGHITVESKLSKGTSMIVIVPVKAVPLADDAEARREANPSLKSAVSSSRITEVGRRA